ncbi:MAG: LmeA family phospholipid-binding protein [Armatimonadetes bacterium]|nr:LmeA family phospholipid-binding protein [Armatimonadota bacterium]
MLGLIAMVVAALLGGSLAGLDSSAGLAGALREQTGEVDQLAVSVGRRPPPEDGETGPGFGAFRDVRVEVRGVDARRLPLAPLVATSRPGTLKGRIDSVELLCRQVRLDNLNASEVNYRARGVAYDLLLALRTGEMQTCSVAHEELEVVLRDGDLDAYAAAAYPELTDAKVTFEQGRLVLRASVPLFMFAFKVKVTGVPAVEEGRRLVLRDPVLDTGRMQLSADLRKSIMTGLNPLVDLDETLEFEVPLTWSGLRLKDGELRLAGHLVSPAPAPVPRRFSPDWRYREQ